MNDELQRYREKTIYCLDEYEYKKFWGYIDYVIKRGNEEYERYKIIENQLNKKRYAEHIINEELIKDNEKLKKNNKKIKKENKVLRNYNDYFKDCLNDLKSIYESLCYSAPEMTPVFLGQMKEIFDDIEEMLGVDKE